MIRQRILIALVFMLGVGSLVQAQDPLTNGLAAYFPFNGNAHDESGHANDALVLGAQLTTDRFGNADRAYQFDGTSSYIRAFADALPTRSKTVSLWFNADTLKPWPVLLAYGGGTCGSSFLMWMNTNYYVAYHCMEGPHLEYGYSEPVGIWKQWVITVDEQQLNMYLDGVRVLTSFQPLIPTHVLGTSLSLGVSVSPQGVPPFTDANVAYFRGKLDDVRIYDRALTWDEVKMLYRRETHQLGTLEVTVKTVQVDMFVVPGKRYQLEMSRSLTDWTSAGEPFLATSGIRSEQLEVNDVRTFFRFHEVP